MRYPDVDMPISYKWNEELTQGSTRIHFKDSMLSERHDKQAHTLVCCLYEMSRIWESIENNMETIRNGMWGCDIDLLLMDMGFLLGVMKCFKLEVMVYHSECSKMQRIMHFERLNLMVCDLHLNETVTEMTETFLLY